MRHTLGIETATRHGSVALAESGAAVAWESLPSGGHSATLGEAAARLLGGRGITLGDLFGIAVAAGPGSFTGLRVGLAWAKGVCAAIPVRLALIGSHEAVAHRFRRPGERLATLLPSERGEVELAIWTGEGSDAPERGPERVLESDLLARLGVASEEGAWPLGVAAPDLRPALGDLLRAGGFSVLAEAASFPPLAAAVAEVGDRAIRAGRVADPITAAPLYGRAPNARKPA
jgi:tRNA threonylcarbamoyladenosine biosynthesis protein TsaB